jgi:chromosome segregation ATPase
MQLSISASKGQVEKQTFQITERKISGFVMHSSESKEQIEESLEDYLKGIGKLETNRGYYTLSEVNNLVFESPLIIYAMIKETDDAKKTVYLGIEEDEVGKENFKKLTPQIQELMEKFALKLTIDGLKNDLVEAEGAAAYKSKIFQKLLKETGSLENKINNNREEKKQLEEDLVRLDEEHNQLQEQLQLNEELKVLANEDIEKIQLRIEQLKKELAEL